MSLGSWIVKHKKENVGCTVLVFSNLSGMKEKSEALADALPKKLQKQYGKKFNSWTSIRLR